ncbi:MAG: hypothetical protein Fur0019_09990 [Tibeticola sp.]
MNQTNPTPRRARAAVAVAALLMSLGAGAANTFDPATNTLLLDDVQYQGMNYQFINAAVTSYDILAVDDPNVTQTTFDPASNKLNLAYVYVGDTKYQGVSVRLNKFELRGQIAPPSELPVLQVPAPTYADGSPALEAYKRLNDMRVLCGSGRLTQNASLDDAATKHATYWSWVPNMLLPNFDRFVEDPAGMYFYAKTTQERAAKSGYMGGATEAVSFDNSVKAAYFVAMDSGYMAQRLLDPARTEIGVSYVPQDGPLGMSTLDFALGAPAGKAPPNVTSVRTYPCEGVTDVFPYVANGAGPDIHVYGDPDTFRLTGATITGPAGPVTITKVLGDGHSPDPQGVFTRGAAIILIEPLAPNSAYQVRLTGVNKGVSFVRTFNFTTGPNKYRM